MSRPLPRNVRLLGWTSFFTDIGSEMILPILPLFLRGALHAPMKAIGLIEGVADASGALLKLVSGAWADRTGRAKPFVFAGYALSAAVKPLIGFATAWPAVLGVRFTDRLGKGLRSAPRDAIVAASTPKTDYGRAYGYHRAMDTGGALVGSGVAAVALWWLGDPAHPAIRWVFAASVIPCVIALWFVLRVREPARRARPSAAGTARPSARLFTPNAARLLAGVTIWQLGNVSYAFVLLRLADLGVRVTVVPMVYVAYNVVYLVAAMPIGILADRLGIRAALLAAPLITAAAFWTLGADSILVATIGGLFLFALHSAAENTLSRAGVAHFAPATGRGTLFGLVGACALLGNVSVGWLWDAFGSATALRLVAGVSLLSVFPFAWLRSSPTRT